MSTVSTVLANLRTRLDETSASEWTDAQLITYLSNGEQWLADRIGRLIGSGRFRYRDTITLGGSAETYALTSLTKRFAEVIEIQQLWQGEYIDLPFLHDGDDGRARSLSLYVPGSVIPHYSIFNDELKFLPVSTEARTIYLLYRYLPSFKTTSGETLETPQDWDHLLVLRAAHFANSAAGQVNTAFDDEYASLLAELEDREQGRAFGSREEVVKPSSTRAMFF